MVQESNASTYLKHDKHYNGAGRRHQRHIEIHQDAGQVDADCEHVEELPDGSAAPVWWVRVAAHVEIRHNNGGDDTTRPPKTRTSKTKKKKTFLLQKWNVTFSFT